MTKFFSLRNKSLSRKRIHQKLKRHSPEGVKKAKRIFKFKYPKLSLLFISILAAYFLFKNEEISLFIRNLDNLSYLGIFIAGIFLAFGFSASFSIGFFIISQPSNIILATLIGGLGAITSDLLIFKFIKLSFIDEFNELKKAKVIKKIRKIIHQNKNLLIRHYLIYAFAGIIIATPLPDEIGVSMFAGLTSIKPEKLAAIGFFLHSLVIFLILKFSIVL